MFPDPSPALVADLRARFAAVREEIADAAVRAGRDPASVRLVAVTKTHPADVLAAATRAGAMAVGENYVQEAGEKFRALGWPAPGEGPVVRHLIGPLQTNKVRKALEAFDVIETVDSLALAQRLDRIAGELGRVVPAFVQVNTSGEATKAGFISADVAGILPMLANLSHIQFMGLMTIGRFTPDPEAARGDFRALRTLRDALTPITPAGIALTELSMGMSHDFAVAIAEGATIVRIGSRLFGPRS